MTKEFDDFRFKGFKYEELSDESWEFNSQINDDKTKALIRMDNRDFFEYIGKGGRTEYCLKLDRNHCIFLRGWQLFKDISASYILLNKEYYCVVKSKKPFEEKPDVEIMKDWSEVLKKAKSQEEDSPMIIVKKPHYVYNDQYKI